MIDEFRSYFFFVFLCVFFNFFFLLFSFNCTTFVILGKSKTVWLSVWFTVLRNYQKRSFVLLYLSFFFSFFFSLFLAFLLFVFQKQIASKIDRLLIYWLIGANSWTLFHLFLESQFHLKPLFLDSLFFTLYQKIKQIKRESK